MRIREYSLSPGWYPREAVQAQAQINSFLSTFPAQKQVFRAAIAPHAGWYYSGRLSCLSISALAPAQTIVVLGGHLPPSSPALFAMEDAVKTPFDPMLIDKELRDFLIKELNGEEDRFRDNTVEVLLPIVRHFFPKAMLLWLRLPADISSYEAGKAISKASAKLKRTVNVIASIDLTHYGANYGFSPKGRGRKALQWVREINDAAFISAVEEGRAEAALFAAEKEKACCSAGAALGVMGFAKEESLSAKVFEYAVSADVTQEEDPDSFVGYVSMGFC